MIVTESDRDSKSSPPSESPTASTSHPNDISNSRLPPPYQTVPIQSPPMSQTLPLVTPKAVYREPARKRFSKALCAAIVIYILMGILIKKFIHLAEKHFMDGLPSGPLREDGRIISCANQTWDLHTKQTPFPSIPPYTSTSSFSIPVASSHIFLFSRGSYGHGNIKIQLSNRPDDKILIEIIMRYHSLEARNLTNICHLERDKHGQGIGIYTPRRIYPNYPGPDEQITFDVTILFPSPRSSKHPLVINSLKTDMGIWNHDIMSLENHVMFRSLFLSGSNSYIRADSVSAEFVQLRTTNAQITGSYNVSDSLVLQTSNGAIRATLRMENNDGHQATQVKMVTSNARIESPITLISTDNSSAFSPAAFSVTAKTSNSPVNITFPDAPSSPFSLLNLHVKSSNAAVNTKLHPTYEGSISLRTSISTPSLLQKSRPTDPSGSRRQQNVEIRKVLRGKLDAGVWWGDDPSKDEGKGAVVVSTSNGLNIVELS